MYAGYKEEGDICGVDGCDGKLCFPRINCSCHISPPCSACENNCLCCSECGWTNEQEPPSRIVHGGCGIGIVEYKPRKLDSTKIDYRSKCHTSSTMIKEGVYPEYMSQGDVEAEVRGTFGGRFEYFGNGKFKYIAYTD